MKKRTERIHGINLDLTESLKDTINKEILDFQEYISENYESYSINVNLSVDKLEQICYIKLVIGPKVFNVVRKNEDMYVSIDKAFKVLRNNYSKYQHKLQSQIRRGESIKDIFKEDIIKEEESLLQEEE